jgi:TonB-dependent starch-binding outer membrane protein SusC
VASEVKLNADSLEFIGPSQPTRQATLNATVGLFRNRVQLSTTFDYRGGNYVWNLQEEFRCATIANCEALYVAGSSLERQARIIARTQFGPLNTNAGFIEKADFVKWREVSATLNVPASWARSVRAERLSVTVTGRNLATFTDYSGLDPEVNGQATSNFAQREFLSVPPLRQLVVRLNLTY